jgi:hypothetical protein
MVDNHHTLNVKMNNKLPLSENEISNLLRRDQLNLDLRGINLSGDTSLFLYDAIISNRLLAYKCVNVSNCRLSSREIESIIKAVTQIKYLESFICSNNFLTKDTGLIISRLLGAQGRLNELNVSNNDLGDIGVASIAGAFTIELSIGMSIKNLSLNTLTILDLSSNNFGDMGVLALCRGLTHYWKEGSKVGQRSMLKTLRLQNNAITDRGAQCLAQLLTTTSIPSNDFRYQYIETMKELFVSDNPIGSQGMIALIETSSHLSHLALARCRPDFTVLKSLSNLLNDSISIALEEIELDFTENSSRDLVTEVERLHSSSLVSNTSFLSEVLRSIDKNQTNALNRITFGSLRDIIQSSLSTYQQRNTKNSFIRDLEEALSVLRRMALSQPTTELLTSSNGERFEDRANREHTNRLSNTDQSFNHSYRDFNDHESMVNHGRVTPWLEQQNKDISRIREEHAVRID